jgi:hypothetical protein
VRWAVDDTISNSQVDAHCACRCVNLRSILFSMKQINFELV